MSADKKGEAPTIAEALDATRWDFVPEPERKMLLRPVGSIFENLPWEARSQHLGPAPIEETDTDDRADRTDTPKSPDDES